MSDQEAYAKLKVGVGKFYYGRGCLAELAGETARLGGRPLVIGGPTTTPLVLDQVQQCFAQAGIVPTVRVHTGPCSRAWAERYRQEALDSGCTLILGIGGGKCLDLAKCAATFGDMDLICVPTSVATCVASSSVCIMYQDDGSPDGSVAMNKEVDVVIADTDVIATAPKRTLAAGIFDSIAKLPEVVHNATITNYRDCSLEKYICTVNAQAIYQFLTGEGKNVYDNGMASGRFTDLILTNLLHTSVVSGFSSGLNQLALAHGLYDFMRRSFTQEAAPFLHGEIVAVGVLMQIAFNEVHPVYLNEVRELMRHMGMPDTLNKLGFFPSDDNIESLLEYLISSTGLQSSDRPRLLRALRVILQS